MTGSFVAEWERQPGFGAATIYDQHALRVTGQPATRRPVGAFDMFTVVGLVLVGIGLPAALALWAHSFNIPRNDDWAYRRILLEFVHSGHYSLVGWGSMSLVGQILWAAPFVLVLGAHTWVPGLAVAVTAAIGLVSAYIVARSVLARSAAAAIVLTVLALPGFLVNTSTFMSDVPAFAADVACLVLGLVAVARPVDKRWPWVVASVAVGVVGFSIRQFDLAAPLSVVVVLAATDRRRLARYSIVGGCTLVACGAIFAWTATLAHSQPKHLGLPTSLTWQTVGVCYFTLSFLVAPWLPGAVRRSWAGRSSHRWRGALAGVVALAIGVLLLASRPALLLGNYLSQSGVIGGQALFGNRPELFARPIWWLMELVALVSGATLAFAMASIKVTAGTGGWQRRPPAAQLPRRGDRNTAQAQAKVLVTVFTLLNVAGLAGYAIFVQAAFWDRYLWPVAFGAAILLAAPRPGAAAHLVHRPGGQAGAWGGRAAPVALALMLAVVTAALTLNSDAYDAARWSAGRDAVKAGFAAGTVDAGFEWVGSHTAAMARPGRRVPAAPPYDTWYDQMFPAFKECAFVSGSRLDQAPLVLIRTIHYKELAFAVPEVLYLYAVRTRACAT